MSLLRSVFYLTAELVGAALAAIRALPFAIARAIPWFHFQA